MKWFEIKNESEDRAEVWIYDMIGEDFWGEGIAAKKFVKELAELDVSQIDLHVNSPGGSVFDGQAIYNAIKRHRANVTTYVDGLAASIASVVALAGDTVIMAENALMMIHNAWAIAIGNAQDMRESADVLDKIDETILGVYARKTGLENNEIAEAMAEETWFTAQEAFDFGLADEIETGVKAAAYAINEKLLAQYRRVPEALKQPSEPSNPGRIKPYITDSPTDLAVIPLPDFPTGAVGDGDGASQANKYDFELERIKLRR